jgi:F0F1-type ATP synthase membrane subunit c/vacuolar-type H+-ATPase subunit K
MTTTIDGPLLLTKRRIWIIFAALIEGVALFAVVIAFLIQGKF